MGRNADISIRRKQLVKTLLLSGKSYRQVQKECEQNYGVAMSLGTVHNIASEPAVVSKSGNRSNSGRKRKLTDADVRVLKREAKKNRIMTCQNLADASETLVGRKVSKETVRNELQKADLHKAKPSKKPKLTESNISDRLSFARSKLDWENEWRSVIFSDEKKFCLFGNDAGVKLWMTEDEIRGKAVTTPTVKFSPSILVWGCFSYDGVGILHVCEAGQTINAERYVSILENGLVPSIDLLFDGRRKRVTFQDDNARCHRAASVKAWFKTQGIKHMEWPAQSADLNPIENLWGLMITKLRRRTFENVDELTRTILDVWNHEIDIQVIHNLVDSMPRRMREVVRARGRGIDY